MSHSAIDEEQPKAHVTLCESGDGCQSTASRLLVHYTPRSKESERYRRSSVPILPFTIWVTMGKSSQFSKPHLSSSLKQDNSHLMGVEGAIDEMMHIKSILHSAWYVVSS